MARACGSCSACCEVAEVPGLKAGHTPCRYQRTMPNGCCTIFGDEARPTVCTTFQCAWLRGFGGKYDRPDVIGAILTINETAPGKVIGFLGELVPNAATSTAKPMAVAFARFHDMPLIVVQHGKDDGGRWVVVKDSLRERAMPILGPLYIRLADDVGMYERRRAPSG